MDLQWKVRTIIPLLKTVEKQGSWCVELKKEDMLPKTIKLQVNIIKSEYFANFSQNNPLCTDLLILFFKHITLVVILLNLFSR